VIKRLIIFLALAGVVAVPFMLRPAHLAPARADDALTLITPHNEAIRHEFSVGFRRWYYAKTGRTVNLDWRVIGGTSDITRFLESEYAASFQNYWTGQLHRPWSTEVQAAFANPRLGKNAPEISQQARAIFLASEVGCGIDLFFGGGPYDFMRQADAGRLVPSAVALNGAEWFRDAVIPEKFAGETYRDPQGRWIGNVLSSYGILYNRDSLVRLGIDRPPAEWADLADPRYLGQVALADPTKSGSIAKAFENLVQEQIQRRLVALRATDGRSNSDDSKAIESQAIREGWLAGLRLLQLIGANSRYFTDTSQKPPIDVSQGDCAAGICIDFYGRSQAGVTQDRGGESRLRFVSPRGGSVSSVDPIAILRGAPHRAVAEAFVEYTLSMEAQKLWNFRPGTPGGPERFALRRLPVRRDFYEHAEWKAWRSDPEADPFADTERLIYQPAWTEGLFRELAFIIRVMAIDTHDELVRAWRAIQAAPPGVRERALSELQDLSAVNYLRAGSEIKQAMNSKNKVDEVTFARGLAENLRQHYAQAEAIAKGE
jgi:iron(III) transport system substrate-binding protein